MSSALSLFRAILAVWIGFRQLLDTFGFYALFALALTVSVQPVGVYLVFACLIIPALATHKFLHQRMLIAYAAGTTGYACGLLLSVWLDLPTRAAIVRVIVWAMALTGAMLMLLKRSK